MEGGRSIQLQLAPEVIARMSGCITYAAGEEPSEDDVNAMVEAASEEVFNARYGRDGSRQ